MSGEHDFTGIAVGDKVTLSYAGRGYFNDPGSIEVLTVERVLKASFIAGGHRWRDDGYQLDNQHGRSMYRRARVRRYRAEDDAAAAALARRTAVYNALYRLEQGKSKLTDEAVAELYEPLMKWGGVLRKESDHV